MRKSKAGKSRLHRQWRGVVGLDVLRALALQGREVMVLDAALVLDTPVAQ